MKTKFREYLSEFMNKNEYTLDYISTITKVSKASIGHYKTGKRLPSYKFLETFFNKFSIPLKEQKEIITMVENEKIPEKMRKIKVGNIDLNNPITEFKQIPIYDSISAGFGSCESGIIGHMPLPQTNGFKGDVIGIKVDGDSMQPDIKNGDTVLIKIEVMPENGEVGAFILNDEGLLKRYKKTDRGDIILSSDNKDYDPIIINESDEFHIVGKKVGVFNH